jgi:hypothetical protein
MIDVVKAYRVCKEIASKTKPPREIVVEDGTEVTRARPFTLKEQRMIAAHEAIWLEMIYDAFGIEAEDEEVQ